MLGLFQLAYHKKEEQLGITKRPVNAFFCFSFLCARQAPTKKNAVPSIPDVSFSQATSQLETGTSSLRKSDNTPEGRKLLEENSDVEHCLKNMDKQYNVSGSNTDGSFTTAVSNRFWSPLDKSP